MTDPSKILAAAKAYRSAMEDPNADGEQTAMLAQRLLSAAEGVEDFGDDDRDRRIATEARDLHAKITQVIVPALDQIAVALEAQAERGATATRRFKVGDRVRIARKFEEREGTAARGAIDWVCPMDQTLGMTGTVVDIDKDGDIDVDFNGSGWYYTPEALDLLPAEEGAVGAAR